MSSFQNIGNIRSDVFQLKNRQEAQIKNEGHRSIPCFCLENAKHPKWKLCPIDMTPKLYFVNNHKKKNKYGAALITDVRNPAHLSIVNTKKSKSSHWTTPSYSTEQVTPNTHSNARFNKDVQQIKRRIDTFKEKTTNKTKEEMTLRFRIDSANTDRKKTLKKGFFKKDVYSAPRPHHFQDDIHRPLETEEELGKPDFKIKTERDPRNIKFKKYTINSLRISELASTKDGEILRLEDERLPMITHLPQQPRFDSNLIYPKKKYMKGRDPTDVLYEKIAKAKGLPFTNEEFNDHRPDIFDHKTEDLLEITRTGPRHKCLHRH